MFHQCARLASLLSLGCDRAWILAHALLVLLHAGVSPPLLLAKHAQLRTFGVLQFDLTVSGPARATVRGTNGLEPFELDIQPTGASVSKI